jgi:hypothetical protein
VHEKSQRRLKKRAEQLLKLLPIFWITKKIALPVDNLWISSVIKDTKIVFRHARKRGQNVSGLCYNSIIKKVEKGSQIRKES